MDGNTTYPYFINSFALPLIKSAMDNDCHLRLTFIPLLVIFNGSCALCSYFPMADDK